MRHVFLGLCLLAAPVGVHAQVGLPGDYVVRRSIEYHDPSGRWSTFARTLVLRETRPGGVERTVLVSIDKPNERFMYERDDNGVHVRTVLDRVGCTASLNGSPTFSATEAQRHGLDCAAIERRRDYYQYLYGLPMKLRDRGTIVAPRVIRTSYQGREVLQIDVTYDEAVGTDTWHFYFDPATFRLVGYRFNHDESLNDGEYIVLEDEYLVDDMRIPRTRKWFRNTDDGFLGTDVLESHRRVTYSW